jgi:hypothetical protein
MEMTHKDPLVRIADALDQFLVMHKSDKMIVQKLDLILIMLAQSKEREAKMALELTALETEVSQNTTVVGSAVVLLNGLKTKMEELVASMVTEEDKAKLQSFVDTLDANEQALAAAVAAHTPAQP